jgi:DNA invertase Pin-like site-specific DNA recombinase
MKSEKFTTYEFKMKVYGYLRVSTDDQDENSQKRGVDEFASKNGLKIDEYVIDHGLSGAKEFKDRVIGKLIKKLQKGDTVIASEISRIGRRLVLVLDFIKICTEKGVNFFTVKDRYSIADTLQSKVILTVMGLCAEIERDLVRQRTKEGLSRARAEGKILGRPKGRKTAPEKHKLNNKEALIRSLMDEGLAQRKIAAIVKVNRNTLAKFINERGLKNGKLV